MQNLGNVYIWGSPFVMSRTDAQNGVDIIFKSYSSGEASHIATGHAICKFLTDDLHYSIIYLLTLQSYKKYNND
jgi:hypothetical protein